MDYDNLPMTGKISIAACLGERVMRPGCSCCGGEMGIRRAHRKLDQHANPKSLRGVGKHEMVSRGRKPRHKDHRV